MSLNPFLLRAKYRAVRAKPPFVPPAKMPLKPRAEDIPVNAYQYLIGLRHLARAWNEQLFEELSWFLASLRGELPVDKKSIKNYSIVHITLPPRQYFLALEALTTRLGVKI